jgi:hypothetical protein
LLSRFLESRTEPLLSARISVNIITSSRHRRDEVIPLCWFGVPFRVSFDPEDLRIEGNPFRMNPHPEPLMR